MSAGSSQGQLTAAFRAGSSQGQLTARDKNNKFAGSSQGQLTAKATFRRKSAGSSPHELCKIANVPGQRRFDTPCWQFTRPTDSSVQCWQFPRPTASSVQTSLVYPRVAGHDQQNSQFVRATDCSLLQVQLGRCQQWSLSPVPSLRSRRVQLVPSRLPSAPRLLCRPRLGRLM